MKMKFQIKDLAVSISRISSCKTPTACDPPITSIPFDAAFKDAAVSLLSKTLNELRRAKLEPPQEVEESPEDE